MSKNLKKVCYYNRYRQHWDDGSERLPQQVDYRLCTHIVFAFTNLQNGMTLLWQLLRKYGCSETFTTMIEALYTGMMANVSVGGEVSESFIVTNGVKQGCILAPRSSPFSYQQCSMRLSETCGMISTYSPDRALTFSTSHSSERRPRLLGY